MNFQIPKGYEDFVSSKEDLLREVKLHPEFQQDHCLFRVFFAENVSVDEAIRFRASLECELKTLLSFKAAETQAQYLWHIAHALDVICCLSVLGSNHSLMCTVQYGDNVEDEWFLVYLLLTISKTYKDILIQVCDNDGEFMLIEAADHLDSWLGPENATNRVWIRQGSVHIISPDISGADSTGGMQLDAALTYLRNSSDSSNSVARRAIQRAIHQRTTGVYPHKIPALDHHIACILPRWLAFALQRDSQLIALAVHALSTTDGDRISKLVQKVDLVPSEVESSTPSNIITNDDLVACSVRMTKAQYAQMTFKNFKVPRRYHTLQRRMALGNSAKIAKAFDLGCRILCGLELAYKQSLDSRVEVEKYRADNLRMLEQMSLSKVDASKNKLFATEPTHLSLSPENFRSVVQQVHALSLTCHEVLGKLLHSYRMEPFPEDNQSTNVDGSQDTELFRALKEASATIGSESAMLRWDADDWLYMQPEVFEARIQALTAQYQQTTPTQTNLGSDREAAEDKVQGDNSGHDNGGGEGSLGGDTNTADLQEIVDRFKNFLSEESDYTGIGNQSTTASTTMKATSKQVSSKSSKSKTTTKSSVNATTSSQSSTKPPSKVVSHEDLGETKGFDAASLDLDYLTKLLEASTVLDSSDTVSGSATIERETSFPTQTVAHPVDTTSLRASDSEAREDAVVEATVEVAHCVLPSSTLESQDEHRRGDTKAVDSDDEEDENDGSVPDSDDDTNTVEDDAALDSDDEIDEEDGDGYDNDARDDAFFAKYGDMLGGPNEGDADEDDELYGDEDNDYDMSELQVHCTSC